MNIALIMGRAGSKSILGKNVINVCGEPLVYWPFKAALDSEKIDMVAVTTDCLEIQRVAENMGVEIIDRPPSLSHDTAQMVDGITHALEVFSGKGIDVEYLVTMHANCATHTPGLVDTCLERLIEDPDADSCVSGTVDKAIHPFRTRKLSESGQLETWGSVPEGTSSNRQSLEPCVILDGAARAMRVSKCFPPCGDAPFPYLGKRVLFTDNPGGLDVHDEGDILLSELFLRSHYPELHESLQT